MIIVFFCKCLHGSFDRGLLLQVGSKPSPSAFKAALQQRKRQQRRDQLRQLRLRKKQKRALKLQRQYKERVIPPVQPAKAQVCLHVCVR